MVRAGKRKKKRNRKLEPPLPEAKEELNLPRYFRMIRGGRRAEGEERKEILPKSMPGRAGVPKTVRRLQVKKSRRNINAVPINRQKTEKIPQIIKAARRFKSILSGIEPKRPVRMPVVPEMHFPTLYRRLPTMKTVTKVTDINGKITVDFPHPFEKVPEVIITVKGEDTLIGNVTDITLSTFTVIFFTVEHDHGGVVDNDGAHTAYIYNDGYHSHTVGGTIQWIETGQAGGLLNDSWTSSESPDDPHHHTLAATFTGYLTHIDISAVAWTSDYESPYHGHSGGYVNPHGHGVAKDGGVLLKDTSVTLTYMAQEGSG